MLDIDNAMCHGITTNIEIQEFKMPQHKSKMIVGSLTIMNTKNLVGFIS